MYTDITSLVLGFPSAHAAATAENAGLELLASFSLNGVVEDLAVLRSRASLSQRDAVLLTFRDAKVSVLEWDEAQHSVRSSSLHYFEGDAALREGRSVFAPPRVVTDPQGRCAAVVMFQHQLALLPAMEAEGADLLDVLMEGEEVASGPTSATTVGNSYLVNLSKLPGLHIQEVRSATFLHGYIEPVLVLLHETMPSWPGRYRDRKDKCALVAMSINLRRKRHPVIWSAKDLPSDCHAVHAVPRGGVLVLSKNLILYYTQGSSCSLLVNSQGIPGEVPPKIEFNPQNEPPSVTASHLAHQYALNLHPEAAAAAARTAPRAEGLEAELDGSQVAWLSGTDCLLALRSGQLLIATLRYEGGTCTRIQASMLMVAPAASCLCVLDERLLFLGAWTADSMLLRYESERVQRGESEVGPASKRRRLGWEMDGVDEDDELLFRGSEHGEHGGPKYTLKVLDSLLSLGPVQDLVVWDPAEGGGEEDVARGGPQLIACIGHDKAGALTMLRHSIVPEVLEPIPLDGVRGLWAVHWRDKQAEGGGGDDEPASEEGAEGYHAMLLLGLQAGTMVIQAGEELEEVTERVGFAVDETTVAAASFFSASAVCQVSRRGVRLVAGPEVVASMALSEIVPGSEADQELFIEYASIADPWVVVGLSSRRVVLLGGDAQQRSLRLVPGAAVALQNASGNSGGDGGHVTASCLFHDSTGYLTKATARQMVAVSGAAAAVSTAPQEPAVFWSVCQASGRLDLYHLPSMTPVFSHPSITSALAVMTDQSAAAAKTTAAATTSSTATAAARQVVELLIVSFSGASAQELHPLDRPCLLAVLGDGAMLIYQAFRPEAASLSFRKVPVDFLQHRQPASLDGEQLRSRMVVYRRVGQGPWWSGVFVGGQRPLWLVATRGTLVGHPMLAEGPVAAMTPFHNINCPDGFIVSVRGGEPCICQLPAKVRLDSVWVTHKIPLRMAVHKVAVAPGGGPLVALTSRQVPPVQRLPEQPGGDPHAAAAYAVADALCHATGREELYEVRVLVPGSWHTAASAALQPSEVGLTIRPVHLRCTTTDTMHDFIAVGTSMVLGEDYPAIGRVYLFVLEKEQAPKQEPDGEEPKDEPQDQWKLRQVFFAEHPAPVTIISDFKGYFMMSSGNKFELHFWTGRALVKSVFFDMPLLISSAKAWKDFILLGDVHKGINFIHYREVKAVRAPERELKLLGKDFDASDIMSLEFILNRSKLFFVCSDAGGTLRIMVYDVEDRESHKGKRLLLRGALHTGSTCTAFVRLKMISEDNVNRHAALWGSLDGSYGLVAPLWNSAASDRLVALQELMVAGIPHTAGLNPKAFRRRYVKVPKVLGGGQSHSRPLKDNCLLDGDLLWSFPHLDEQQQRGLAQAAGCEPEQILQDLAEIQFAVSFL